MRTVARYSIEANAGDANAALIHHLTLADHLEAWLRWKGELVYGSSGQLVGVRFQDGREAVASSIDVDVLPDGALRSVKLTEPIYPDASFETAITLTLRAQVIHVYANLRVGGGADRPLAPLSYEARCPRLIRDCIGYELPWNYAGDSIRRGREKKRGRQAGEALVQLITSATRMLPLVVVSEHLGFMLHPNIAVDLGHELLGLAHVVQIDDDAAWGLTRTIGPQWSCYNGAVRLYWPRVDTRRDPFAHPLWTARKLLDFNPDTRISAEHLCSHIRRRLTELSAFTIQEPAAIGVIVNLERERRFAAERAGLEGASEYRQLAESYADEVVELRRELTNARTEIEALSSKVDNLNLAVQWKDDEEQPEIEPETETPPTTVEEAVARAAREADGVLLFGDDVRAGVAGLFPQAGPPEKVLQYLRALARMSEERRAGPLGTSMVAWFGRENINASQESETTVNSAAARARRTFHDGRGTRFFEWHLKPNEATSPDRCVRIYFDWSEDTRQVVVGWVGRHPS